MSALPEVYPYEKTGFSAKSCYDIALQATKIMSDNNTGRTGYICWKVIA